MMTRMFIGLVAAAVIWALTRSMAWPFAGVIAGMVWAAFWPGEVVAQVSASMTRKDRLCLRGSHIMEALPAGLWAKCDVAESTIAWIGIRDLIRTPDHVFVMLDEMQGYVIPRKLVTSGELDAFIGEVERLRNDGFRESRPSL